jgi:accessory gene regulator protein AgrB
MIENHPQQMCKSNKLKIYQTASNKSTSRLVIGRSVKNKKKKKSKFIVLMILMGFLPILINLIFHVPF